MLKEIWDFIKNNKWYVLLVMGLLGLYFYQFHGGLSSESEKWDHFGSYVGGIFSAVTLLSVLHGMQLERKRFNEQRIEFENEKKEQEERRKKEDFDNKFFYLLSENNRILSRLDVKVEDKNFRTVVEFAYEDICSYSTDYLREIVRKRLDVYFESLLFTLNFLNENGKLNTFYSNYFINIVPVKLKMIFLFYINSLTSEKEHNIKLIEKSDFFNNLSPSDLKNDTSKEIYNDFMNEIHKK